MNHLSKAALRHQAFQHTMVWIGIGTIAITLIKTLLLGRPIADMHVEIFVLAMISLYLIIGVIRGHQALESDENPLNRLQYALIYILLMGGFFVHFLSVSITYKTMTFYQTTSLILTFAMIILIIQFKKRHLYIHEHLLGKKHYVLEIFKRIVLFGGIFSMNLIPIFYYEASALVGSVVVSYVSLSLTYLIFSLYEMYDHQEMTLLSQHKMPYMSKTVVLILIIPILFTFVEYFVQHAVTYDVFFREHQLNDWLIIQVMIKWIGINVFGYAILAWGLMVLHLRKLPINRMVSRIVLIQLILNVISFVYGTTINLFMNQIIDRYRDQIGNIGLFVSRLSYISLFFFFTGLLLTLLIWLYLYKYRLKGQILLLLSAMIPLVLYFARNFSISRHNADLFIALNIIGFLTIPLLYIFLIIQTRSFVDLRPVDEDDLAGSLQDQVESD